MDATTKSSQVEYDLGMVPNNKNLQQEGLYEYVLLMVQRPNVADMWNVPSRLSGKGSAKTMLGLQKRFMVHAA